MRLVGRDEDSLAHHEGSGKNRQFLFIVASPVPVKVFAM